MTAKQAKNDVTIDVDALEREETPEPFLVRLGGKKYTLVDPVAVEWKYMALITSQPGAFLALAVPEAKREGFLTALNDVPAWKVNELAGAYRRHFGMLASPEA